MSTPSPTLFPTVELALNGRTVILRQEKKFCVLLCAKTPSPTYQPSEGGVRRALGEKEERERRCDKCYLQLMKGKRMNRCTECYNQLLSKWEEEPKAKNTL